MKIAFLEPHLKLYGGIRRVLELSNRLVQRGHDVTIYHSDGSSCTWMECRATTRPIQEILQEHHDVLIYNDPTKHDLDLAQRVQAKLKVFYVLELYKKELMLPGLDWRKLLRQNSDIQRTLIMKQALYQNDLLLVNASWLSKWLHENLQLESILLLGGVNTEMFHPVEIPKDPNVTRIIYSGDRRPRKGTEVIEAALRIVQKELPDVVLETYAGKGIPQSEMAKMYSSADIFVDGQFSAGWNNPVAEAMACKVPVVCTDIGGVQDFAFHEQTALLVPQHNAEAMAEAILRLARDPELRQRLSENAVQHIRTFKWDESAAKLENILEEGLQQSSFNGSYTGYRHDIAKLVPLGAKNILDVGCSVGALGSHLRLRNQAKVTGLELDPEMIAVASTKLDRVIQGNVEELDWDAYFKPGDFDCIIFGDLLEHLHDPWTVLKKANRFLAPNGVIVASLPNIAHISTASRLIFRQDWPYNDRGLHDRTHLRFFVLRTIQELFNEAGFLIEKVECNYRFIDQQHRINRYAGYIARFILHNQLAYQYLIVATKQVPQTIHDHKPV
jgi:glycosyltransferase involved in cell wall biosynthesis/precorrin-6B methylase 2